jgi:hypothetical protein
VLDDATEPLELAKAIDRFIHSWEE